jgi:hypothetical protein
MIWQSMKTISGYHPKIGRKSAHPLTFHKKLHHTSLNLEFVSNCDVQKSANSGKTNRWAYKKWLHLINSLIKHNNQCTAQQQSEINKATAIKNQIIIRWK